MLESAERSLLELIAWSMCWDEVLTTVTLSFVTAAKCIDQYVRLRVANADGNDEPVSMDPRLEGVVEKMFHRCIKNRQFRQVRWHCTQLRQVRWHCTQFRQVRWHCTQFRQVRWHCTLQVCQEPVTAVQSWQSVVLKIKVVFLCVSAFCLRIV